MSLKSEKAIEKALWTHISNSVLLSAQNKVNGNAYRGEMRPDDSTKEDIVVKFLSGIDSQFQTGVLVVNIYVPDITPKGYKRKVGNSARIEAIEDLLNQAFASEDAEYHWYIEQTPIILESEIGQHIISARVRYNRYADIV